MSDSDKEDLEQLRFTPQYIVDLIYDTLECLHRVFTRNDIPYVIFGGTALGAERHGGLIPWDDDADLCIRTDDEQRLLSLVDTFSHYGFTLTKEPFFGYRLINVPFGHLMLRGLSSTDVQQHLDENYGKDWPCVAWREYDHYYYKGVSNACIKLHDENERRPVQH